MTTDAKIASSVAAPALAACQKKYRDKQRFLLSQSDKLYGIESSFKVFDKKGVPIPYKEGEPPVFVRDARHAAALVGRTLPDKHCGLIANNTLLKALGTLRGVSHVLASAGHIATVEALEWAFADFEQAVTKKAKDFSNNPAQLKVELTALHEKFNLTLLQALNKHQLLKGLEKNPEKLEALLSYCRYLSGLLDPAPAVTTLVTVGNKTYSETCYPLTKKEPEQIAKLEQAILKSGPNEKNFFTKMSAPFRAVTRAFCSQLTDNSSLASPQLRKYIPHGVRQAFAVKRALFTSTDGAGEPIQPIQSRWSVRSGTLAYAGKGESDSNMQQATNQNLLQLKNNVTRVIADYGSDADQQGAKQLHIAMLNTDEYREKQHRMVGMTKEALRLAQAGPAVNGWSKSSAGSIGWSYAPPNLVGRLRAARISGLAKDQVARFSNPLSGSSRVEQSARIGLAVNPGQKLSGDGKKALSAPSAQLAENSITLEAANGKRLIGNIDKSAIVVQDAAGETLMVIDVSTCASGIDRTGTRELMLSWMWLIAALVDEQPLLTEEQILDALAKAGHSSVMAHILCPSTPAMKQDSQPGKLFGPWSEHLYLKSAGANKHTPLYGIAAEEAKNNGRWYGAVVWMAIVIAIEAIPAIFFPNINLWHLWLSFTSAALLGPALLLVMVGGAVLGFTVWALKTWRQDWGAAIFTPILVLIISLGIVLPMLGTFADTGAGALFAHAWQSWAVMVATPLLAPLLVLTLMAAAVLLFCVLPGGKLGESSAKQQFFAALNAPIKEPAEPVSAAALYASEELAADPADIAAAARQPAVDYQQGVEKDSSDFTAPPPELKPAADEILRVADHQKAEELVKVAVDNDSQVISATPALGS